MKRQLFVLSLLVSLGVIGIPTASGSSLFLSDWAISYGNWTANVNAPSNCDWNVEDWTDVGEGTLNRGYGGDDFGTGTLCPGWADGDFCPMGCGNHNVDLAARPVPEPVTLILLSAGLLATGIVRRIIKRA